MSLRNLVNHRWGRLLALSLISVCLLITAACMKMQVLPVAERVTMPESVPRPVDRLDVPHEKDPTRTYRIGPRDILRVEIDQDPRISQPVGYTVTDEGFIILPTYGPVQVSNLTAEEAQQKINSSLAEYIQTPKTIVAVQNYNSKIVRVIGQVNRPGEIIMRADMLTLMQAVFAAGLPTMDAAIQRAQVITPDMENPVVRRIDLTDILYRGKMRENILLKPNDIVYIPSKYGTNLTESIRELIRPIDEIVSFQYRATFSGVNQGGGGSSDSGGGVFGN